MAMIYVMFLFSVLKLEHCINKFNPSINTYQVKEAFGSDETWYPAKDREDFFMAFAVSRLTQSEVKHDAEYVKWFAM